MKHVKSSNAVFSLAIAGFVALLGGCAGTALTSSWESPDYRGGPLKKLAVFVLAKDDSIRRFAEDQMVQKMPAGTTASAGYVLFDKSEVDHEKIRASLVKAGYDGVLVSRLLTVDQSQTYVPPQTNFAPAGRYSGAGPYWGSFGGYYGQGYTVMQTPGYTVENTTVVVETILYKLPEDKPVWTGTTKSLDPRSRPEMVQAITELVEAEMQKKGLIGSGTK